MTVSLRVLLVAPHPFFVERGSPIAERTLVEALCAEGHRVDVLTYHEGRDPDVSGCEVVRIPPPPGVRDVPPGLSWKKPICDAFLAVALLRLVRQKEYDILHGVEEGGMLARVASAITGVPYVHDMDSALSEQAMSSARWLRPLGPVLEALEADTVRHAAGILAVSPQLAERAERLGATGVVRVVEDASLLRGDPDDLSPPDDVARLGSGPLVLYVGNLAPYQGVELLLDAFGSIAAERSDLRLVVVGRGERREALRQRAERLGVAERAYFLGPRPLSRLGAYLSAADVLVSPRLRGVNTPMKIYSYLDSGRPLVATAIPAHTQVLDDSVAVLVAPEVEALAAGITIVLEDPERARRMADRARELARTRYSPTSQAEKIREFYRSLPLPE